MAVIFRASALAGLAERLARVASGKQERLAKFSCWKLPNVFEYPNSWEVFSEDSLGVWLDFAECDGFASCPSTRECESADSAEQIDMSSSCQFIFLASTVAICTIFPIARKSVSMRDQDQDADRYRGRDVIRCNPDHTRRDRSTRQSASLRRLSFFTLGDFPS